MKIVQLTPGAGKMYCGNCVRDNIFVRELVQAGHQAVMLPLYLPVRVDSLEASEGVPIFFGGINVYLEQKSALFRHMPGWLHRVLAHPVLLRWASGRAAKTRAEDVADITLSMMRGEAGNQARELDELVHWLQNHERPDVICISNVLLIGIVRRLRQVLGVPVVCMLQGEDTFLNSLPVNYRAEARRLMVERAAEVDAFIAPSRYFADEMARFLRIEPGRVAVVFNGVDRNELSPSAAPPQPPVLGFFARMCREKGLDTLVEAYLILRRQNRIPGLRLHVGGGLSRADREFVHGLEHRLKSAGLADAVQFRPNLDLEEKAAFLSSMSLCSVPANYGEAFGLYLLEAMGTGVPVVQPNRGAFPEIIAATGGGILFDQHGGPSALADAIAHLLNDSTAYHQCRSHGLRAVDGPFSSRAMAEGMLEVFQSLTHRKTVLSRP